MLNCKKHQPIKKIIFVLQLDQNRWNSNFYLPNIQPTFSYQKFRTTFFLPKIQILHDRERHSHENAKSICLILCFKENVLEIMVVLVQHKIFHTSITVYMHAHTFLNMGTNAESSALALNLISF